jgi:WD40 repeat protein
LFGAAYHSQAHFRVFQTIVHKGFKMAATIDTRRLPAGVKIVRTIGEHEGRVNQLAWSPDGSTIATVSDHKSIRLWNVASGECVKRLKDSRRKVGRIAFHPDGAKVAVAWRSGGLTLWSLTSGDTEDVRDQRSTVIDVAWSPDGQQLAIGMPREVQIVGSSQRRYRFDASLVSPVAGLAWNGQSSLLAVTGWAPNVVDVSTDKIRSIVSRGSAGPSAWSPDLESEWLAFCSEGTLSIWARADRRVVASLERHTARITDVGFSPDGRLLASLSNDGVLCFWGTGEWRLLHLLTGLRSGLAFHPEKQVLAIAGRHPKAVELWELDIPRLRADPTQTGVRYTTAKIVLVGDSGVGKTGLGWRLAHGSFKEHASTHGQQFWMLDQLRAARADGTQCEAILWDLAGQPDYRLIHALFLDDADLSLVVFDPTRSDDPLHGVDFWLKHVK